MFEKALNIEKRSTIGLFPIKKVDKNTLVPINVYTVANLGLIICLLSKRRA